MKYPILLLVLVCFGCKPKQHFTAQQDNQVSLFIIPEYRDSFRVSINDTLHFETYQLDRTKHGPQELITKLNKPADSIKVTLQIANRDTSFVLHLKKVDSLIFGLDMNKHFFVFDQDQYIWYYD